MNVKGNIFTLKAEYINGNDIGNEISLTDMSVDFLVLKKTQENLNSLWIEKISNSLGWNHAFK